MGGVGSGGRRVGAGRKPKDESVRAIDGNAGRRRGRVLPHPAALTPSSQPTQAVEVTPPSDLSADELKVWQELSPHALASRTLTPAMVVAFRMLCKNVVLEAALRLTKPGSADHRGLMQRLQSDLTAFCVRPIGKAITGASTVPTADPMKDKYFGSSGKA